MIVATNPPMPPSSILAKTKKLNAIAPNPIAVSETASTLSTMSTRTFGFSFLGSLWLRWISSSEKPKSRRRLELSSSRSDICNEMALSIIRLWDASGTPDSMEAWLGRKALVKLGRIAPNIRNSVHPRQRRDDHIVCPNFFF